MWLQVPADPLPAAFVAGARRVVVAVPACDEEAGVAACLLALRTARAHPAVRFCTIAVLLLVNNSRDRTARIARRMAAGAAWLQVREVTLPAARAHAGGARRLAMAAAASGLAADAVLMTTDADSRVAPDWIAANLFELDAGADAVAGSILLDPATRAGLPALPGRAAEWRLADAQARLEWLLDPQPHDPWPRHIWAWGASLALTAGAWRRCGGVPAVPLAEDRALADALLRSGCRLRRSLKPRVHTSARTAGRAPGGFADLLRGYAEDPDLPCDAALEPTRRLVRRAVLRARLREPAGSAFGARWAALEAALPELARQRVRPPDLPRELALADRWIRRLEAGRAGTVPLAAAA